MHDSPLKALPPPTSSIACLLVYKRGKFKAEKVFSSTCFAHIIKFLIAMCTINKLSTENDCEHEGKHRREH